MLNGLFTGEPVQKPKGKESMGALTTRTPAHDTLDVRDLITGAVGKGYTGMSDDNIRGVYAQLAGIMGVPNAQKMMDRIFIYNQTPEAKRLPLEDRIRQFYDIKSGNETIDPFLLKAKNFGMGVIAGMNNAPNILNQELSGRAIASR